MQSCANGIHQGSTRRRSYRKHSGIGSFIHQNSSIKHRTSKDNYNNSKRVTINVSGSIFETFEGTLERFPNSLLGDRTKRSHYYCSKTDQYYFSRNRNIFECILFFYQSNGNLYRPNNVNLILFLEECSFFQLPQNSIDVVKTVECCFLTDKVNSARQFPKYAGTSKVQSAVWNFLEYPESSNQARVYFTAQMIFIVISIALFSSESIAGSHHLPSYGDHKKHYEDQSIHKKLWNSPFLITELSITIIFTIDFMLRCIFSPQKRLHFTSFHMYVDLISLVPYSLITSTDDTQLTTIARIMKTLRFLRILKLVRLLTRVSKKLRVLFVIINDSWRDLQIFALGVLLIIFVSAATVFVCEINDEDTKFTSIPKAMWWSLQACITLGYGDIVPQTSLGRLVSSIYMIYGLIWMMLPIIALGLKVVMYGAEVRGSNKK